MKEGRRVLVSQSKAVSL